MHVYLHSYLYLISVSDLVSIYCCFMTLTTTSRSTAAAIATTTAITILLGHLRHTKSQQSPLPRGGQVLRRRSRPTLNRSGCSPTRVRRGWVLPHSIASVQGPQAEEHRGVSAASLRGQRCWINQHAQIIPGRRVFVQARSLTMVFTIFSKRLQVYHVCVLALHQSEARRPASSSGRLCPAGWPGTSLALPCGVASYFRSYSFCLSLIHISEPTRPY